MPLCATILLSGENTKRRWLRDFLLGYVAGLAFFWKLLFRLTTVSALGWFILQFYLAPLFRRLGMVLRTDAAGARKNRRAR